MPGSVSITHRELTSLDDFRMIEISLLLTFWFADPYRATRDVDVLISGQSDEAAIQR